MLKATPASAGRAVRAGIFAGLVGAVLLDGYRLGVAALGHHGTPADHYRYVASALIGQAAYALPATEVAGVLIHLTLSAAWGAGFALAARSAPNLLRRPLFAGTLFGVTVYLVMRLCVLAAGIARTATPSATFVELIAHTIFFGVPIALIVSSRLRHA